MRRRGATARDIGREFGVCEQNGRELAGKAEVLRNLETNPARVRSLNGRSLLRAVLFHPTGGPDTGVSRIIYNAFVRESLHNGLDWDGLKRIADKTSELPRNVGWMRQQYLQKRIRHFEE